MNLAWLAAVLQPRDVTRHPNFRSTDTDTSGVAHLAGLILGGDWWRASQSEPVDSDSADDLRLLRSCTELDEIGTAVPKAARFMRDAPPKDLARAAAYAIFISAAAAELDDFDTAIRTVTGQIDRLARAKGTDAALVRAALLQQRAIRSRDSGSSFQHDLQKVGRLVSEIDPEKCSHFNTSAGVSWTSVQTVRDMRETLHRAASSLMPSDFASSDEFLYSRIDLVRRRASSAEVRARSEQAATLSDFVENQYVRKSDNVRYLMGPPPSPDTYHALLGLELAGSSMVYPARRSLAHLRMLQGGGGDRQLADALRLLRHSGEAKAVSRAVERLRASGPLSALAQDARQILNMRAEAERLRTVELEVLLAASEVLSGPEARIAVEAVAATLEREDGPAGVVGFWQLSILRREVAWKAIAALAGPADLESQVARRLLTELTLVDQDFELADRALRQALGKIDWDLVNRGVKREWTETLHDKADTFPLTTELVAFFDESPFTNVADEEGLQAITSWVNAKMRGQIVDPEPPLDTDSIRAQFAQIRSDASNGRFSMGGSDVGDVVAALLSLGFGEPLWEDLTEFLIDSSVSRDDRSRAFDRLARDRTSVPAAFAERFSSAATAVLMSRRAGFGSDSEIVPYPAALRFFSVNGFVDESTTYGFIAQLFGREDLQGRREAAWTAAVLAARAPRAELLALSLPMSHDADVVVRARAAVALAYLSPSDNPLAKLASERITQLLSEDGIEVPLAIVRALRDSAMLFGGSLGDKLADLCESHPARSVRLAAKEALLRDVIASSSD